VNTGLLLFLPYRAMEQRVLAAVAAAGFDDVTLAQARVFQRIAPGGSRLTDLAEQAQITKQSAGFLVDQLQERGYVERVPDPPTPARGWCASRRAASRCCPSPRRPSPRSRRSGPRTSARARCWDLRTALERLAEITDPYRRG
jgi:hypothetical protein